MTVTAALPLRVASVGHNFGMRQGGEAEATVLLSG